MDYAFNKCSCKKDLYYALFSCDVWKSRSSMIFKGVFTEEGLKEYLKYLTDNLEMNLDQECSIDNLTPYELNNVIIYGYIEGISIDEVI